MKKIKNAVFLFYLINLCNLCFSQVVKTPFPVRKLSWSEDESAFSFSEDNTVFLRDSSDYEFLDSISVPKVEQVSFSKEGTKQVVLTISKDGNFSVFDLEPKNGRLSLVSKNPSFGQNYSGSQEITKVAFSGNSDFVALVGQDNSIDLFFKLRASKEALYNKLPGHMAKIINIEFSKDSRYLLSTAGDGTAIMWNCASGSQILVLRDLWTQNQVPAVFLNNSQIIACDGPSSLVVFNMEGKRISSQLETFQEIRLIKPIADGHYVAVLTAANEIEIYDLQKNRLAGYIPQWTESAVTDFQFNKSGLVFLAGTEDGSIYKFILKDVLLRPDQRPKKKIKVVQADIKKLPENRIPVRTAYVAEGRNSLVISAGAAYLQSPFLASVNIDGQFRYRKNIEPYFAGLGVSGQFGFSRSELSGRYDSYNENFHRMNIISGTFYVPFGIQFSPAEAPEDFYVLFTGKCGTRFSKLALFGSSRFVLGENSWTYYFSCGGGIIYRFFETTINFEYDGIGKFSPVFYAGFNFKIG